MSREIRDMEPRVGQSSAILVAEASRIRFSTTFNVGGNQSATLPPVLTEYRYVPATGDSQGVLYWIRDTNGNGDIDDGDRSRIVATHLLNDDDRPMFTYTYLDSQAARRQSTTISETELNTVQVVDIRVVVDMQPGRAPIRWTWRRPYSSAISSDPDSSLVSDGCRRSPVGPPGRLPEVDSIVLARQKYTSADLKGSIA